MILQAIVLLGLLAGSQAQSSLGRRPAGPAKPGLGGSAAGYGYASPQLAGAGFAANPGDPVLDGVNLVSSFSFGRSRPFTILPEDRRGGLPGHSLSGGSPVSAGIGGGHAGLGGAAAAVGGSGPGSVLTGLASHTAGGTPVFNSASHQRGGASTGRLGVAGVGGPGSISGGRFGGGAGPRGSTGLVNPAFGGDPRLAGRGFNNPASGFGLSGAQDPFLGSGGRFGGLQGGFAGRQTGFGAFQPGLSDSHLGFGGFDGFGLGGSGGNIGALGVNQGLAGAQNGFGGAHNVFGGAQNGFGGVQNGFGGAGGLASQPGNFAGYGAGLGGGAGFGQGF